MVTHKCQIITVDKYGRLVVRIPTSLNERRLFRQVPSNEAITALLPTARKLLRDQRECLGGSGVAIQSDLASGPNAPILRFLRRAAVRCKGQAAGHTKKVTHEQLRYIYMHSFCSQLCIFINLFQGPSHFGGSRWTGTGEKAATRLLLLGLHLSTIQD